MVIAGVFSAVRANELVEDMAKLADVRAVVLIAGAPLTGLSDTLTNEEVESDLTPAVLRPDKVSRAWLLRLNQSMTFFAALLEPSLGFAVVSCIIASTVAIDAVD